MFQIQHLNPAKWQEGNGEGVRGKQQTANSRADYYLPRNSPLDLLFTICCLLFTATLTLKALTKQVRHLNKEGSAVAA